MPIRHARTVVPADDPVAEAAGDILPSDFVADHEGELDTADVTGLDAALSGKAATSHAHAGEDITSGTVADGRVAAALARDDEVAAAYSPLGHTHGASGAPSDAKYVVTAANGTLSNEVVLAGLGASIDIPPGGVNDWEFDTNGLTGWTDLGVPDVRDANTTFLSHLFIHGNADGATANLKGIYRAAPSMPFTMTAKISDGLLRADLNSLGIGYMEAVPGKIAGIELWHSTEPSIIVSNWSSRTNWSSAAVLLAKHFMGFPIYLRVVVTSSTNVAYYFSYGGASWHRAIAGHNPGFTIANVGLYVNSSNGLDPAELVVDWLRFT